MWRTCVPWYISVLSSCITEVWGKPGWRVWSISQTLLQGSRDCESVHTEIYWCRQAILSEKCFYCLLVTTTRLVECYWLPVSAIFNLFLLLPHPPLHHHLLLLCLLHLPLHLPFSENYNWTLIKSKQRPASLLQKLLIELGKMMKMHANLQIDGKEHRLIKTFVGNNMLP